MIRSNITRSAIIRSAIIRSDIIRSNIIRSAIISLLYQFIHNIETDKTPASENLEFVVRF